MSEETIADEKVPVPAEIHVAVQDDASKLLDVDPEEKKKLKNIFALSVSFMLVGSGFLTMAATGDTILRRAYNHIV